ncbi:uncharacterized protein [Pocillopora verrucosa]|uniref:uncharacterized protein isoform X2 n=1 Tax=Pocillopora verrucosa TaxID=203993 RepID=UPI0033416B1E
MHLNGRSSPESKSEALAFDLLCSYTVKMTFKLSILFSFLAPLVVSVESFSSISEKKSSVSKYSVEFSEGGKTFKEEIAIDITKGTETFHVPKTSPNKSAGDIIYDFKKQVTMIHLPAEKACYVANSVDKTPTPAVLKEALETHTFGTGEDVPTTSTEIQMKVVELLDDRSVLSIEMEDLCANLPIYVVVRRAMKPNDKEADVESDKDVDEVNDEEARDFPEITDLYDIPNARENVKSGKDSGNRGSRISISCFWFHQSFD